jgi:uncharacterized RDD family membrane protein YckC
MENKPLKLTEVYETKVYTRNERNEFGVWERTQKELRYPRAVNNLSTGLRLVNVMIDSFFYYYIFPLVVGYITILTEMPLIILIYLFTFPVYYILCEFFFQKTIGKVFTRSIVVDEYGNKPDFKTIVVRSVIRFIPFEWFSFINQSRGWHDRWTNTFVITQAELNEIKELQKDPDNLIP